MKDAQPSEFERRLLDAGRRETLPPELRAQMARALEGVAPATAARSAASWGFGKLVMPVALSAIGLSGLAWYALHQPHRPQPTAAASPVTVGATTTPVTHPQPAAQPNGSLSAASVAHALPPSAATNESDALGAEIALLDRARGALRDHEGARAAAILSDYQRQFARGALRPEADALQIEALLQRGSTTKARQLAQRFLAQHPTHPLSGRVQRWLASAPTR